MNSEAFISITRRKFHATLLASVLSKDENGVPSNADKHNDPSKRIAIGILERLGDCAVGDRLAGQEAGNKFEENCKEFLKLTFPRLDHLRPGKWEITKGVGKYSAISQFDQYEHLASLEAAKEELPGLAAFLGGDYYIKPDVVVVRFPETDENINADDTLVDEKQALYTSLRSFNSESPILHACVSCKWTLRSDRAQNSKSEARVLVAERTGRLPHIVVVTGEPTPSRIASVAKGTGEIDCVYHFALPELLETVKELEFTDAEALLNILIDGKRLRDIADLPFDLII